ncbi:MAG: hypothetical protein KatS3mg084_0396 [Candidatus Dojkabacteria bacterium]|nr:MAG: hypothetical protein KatS3mg084_0396 [Candidatus Dojkabacteria bacterium]
MLNAETKRRIDTARDILVGKIPDPKAQVEQITLALIYKFMDYMDSKSEAMGGQRTFFRGEYEKYAWSKLMDPGLGGENRLKLYKEALEKMSLNPNIEQIFRDIFRGAFLSFNSPETLNLFLKVIDEFEYEHSEDLGDAYEYLLSVMAAQGGAGQFRTPRHIIDFIVHAVEPTKNDKICDPACGTAGFLISAYKYILDQNKDTPLSPSERDRLTDNLVGYDISPDMVRISLVNMFLHDIREPHIYEYDTLSSTDRWDDNFNVILANPPFMTPKGGIMPHSRFSIQSKRAEVLFVDYIIDHLSIYNGRAGIVVPEGIIFQSAKAYKQLRKRLVEDANLYAVVSLPAGVFLPYSGVKTSILLIDKDLARKTDSILFIKVENDGYDLGAQRRPIDKNDLPDALQVILEYKNAVRKNKVDEFTLENKPCSPLLVKKSTLAENGEYNLTGDRYRVVEKRKHQKWPMVKLGEVIELSGKDRAGNENLPIMSITMYKGLIDQEEKFKKRIASKNTQNYKKVFKNELVVGFPIDEGVLGFQTKYEVAAVSPAYNIWKLKKETDSYIPYLEIIFRSKQARKIYKSKMIGTANRRRTIPTSDFIEIQIPLPPLEVQQEIVAEIEGYQKLIDGCRQVIDAWKPDIETYLEEELKNYLAQHPEKKEELANGWPMVRLGEVCEINPKKSEVANLNDDITVSFLPMEDIGTVQDIIPKKEKKLSEVYKGYTNFKENDVLVAKVTPCFENGKSGIARNLKNGIGFGSSELHVLRPIKEKIVSEYIYPYISSNRFIKEGAKMMTGTGGLQRVPAFFIQEYQIPLPPLDIQQCIVEKIEAERRVIDSLREMIKTYEEKIKKVIDRVWGEC